VNRRHETVLARSNGREREMNPIDFKEVVKVQHRGAQLIEVLPRKQYEQQHLPGRDKPAGVADVSDAGGRRDRRRATSNKGCRRSSVAT
jgi:hypothetical protein